MPTPYTGLPGGASPQRTAPTISQPADGDAGVAATFTPPAQTLADEVAALKQSVAYTNLQGNVQAWAEWTTDGVGGITINGSFNVAGGPTFSGGDIVWTFVVPITLSNYALVFGSNLKPASPLEVDGSDITSGFPLQTGFKLIRIAAGGQVNLSTNARSGCWAAIHIR